MKHLLTTLTAAFLFLYADMATAQLTQLDRMAEGIIRIAEPGQLADSVNVWGDINNPGRYLVPRGTRVHELISYARGPNSFRTTETMLDWSKLRVEINISRFDPDNGIENVESYQFRYSDPYPAELRNYQLSNDEIVMVELKRRAGFHDYVRVVGPIVSIFASAALIYYRLD